MTDVASGSQLEPFITKIAISWRRGERNRREEKRERHTSSSCPVEAINPSRSRSFPRLRSLSLFQGTKMEVQVNIEENEKKLEKIKKSLECIVCLQQTTSPLYVCNSGHLICLACGDSLGANNSVVCPTCQEDFRRHEILCLNDIHDLYPAGANVEDFLKTVSIESLSEAAVVAQSNFKAIYDAYHKALEPYELQKIYLQRVERDYDALLEEYRKARRSLIIGWKEKGILQSDIGIKQLGILDIQPFLKALDGQKKKVKKAKNLQRMWHKRVRDLSWMPMIKKVAGEDPAKYHSYDTELDRLRKKHGEEVCNAVLEAKYELTDHLNDLEKDLDEYLKIEEYDDLELWNFKAGKAATLEEGIDALLD